MEARQRLGRTGAVCVCVCEPSMVCWEVGVGALQCVLMRWCGGEMLDGWMDGSLGLKMRLAKNVSRLAKLWDEERNSGGGARCASVIFRLTVSLDLNLSVDQGTGNSFFERCGDASEDFMFCLTAGRTEVERKGAFLRGKVLFQSCDWLVLSEVSGSTIA